MRLHNKYAEVLSEDEEDCEDEMNELEFPKLREARYDDDCGCTSGGSKRVERKRWKRLERKVWIQQVEDGSKMMQMEFQVASVKKHLVALKRLVENEILCSLGMEKKTISYRTERREIK